MFNTITKALSNIPVLLDGAIQGFFYSVCVFIYGFIDDIYNAFLTLSNAQIIETSQIKEITSRIGLILGLLMVFMVSFSFIQMILDPDKISDKEMGVVAIVKKCLIVVVMLALSPYAFKLLYNVQNTVLNSNLIGNLFIPSGMEVISSENGKSDFGKILSANLFTSFYSLDDSLIKDGTINNVEASNGLTSVDCYNYWNQLRENIAKNGDYSIGRKCLGLTTSSSISDDDGSDAEFIMKFNWILALIVGIAICYFLLMYAISAGTRVIQLALLQMVSPAAFISYLSPKKDTMFDKWKNMYISTYIDVFIRVAIINLIVYVISIILNAWNGLGDGSIWGTSSNGGMFVGILMIIAALSFAKKAPDLIKDLFPTGGASKLGFGFSAKDRAGLGMLSGAAAGAVTGVVGGVAGGKGVSRVTGALGGAFGGVARGFMSGAGGKGTIDSIKSANSTQSKANLARAQRIASGATLKEGVANRARSLFGVEVGSAQDERDINTLSSYSGILDSMQGNADNNKVIKRLKWDYEHMQKNDGETDENYRKRLHTAENQLKAARKEYISRVLDGTINNGNPINYSYNNEVTGRSSTESFTVNTGDDEFNISSILSSKKQAENLRNENSTLFKGYNAESNYDNIDNNTNRAKSEIESKRASQRKKYN